jgi:O-methyltransferase
MDLDKKSLWYNSDFVSYSGGFYIPQDQIEREIIWSQPWDTVRRDVIILLLRSIVERNIIGACVELGVYKGETARLIHHCLPERKLFLFDTFSGFGERGRREEARSTKVDISAQHFEDTSVGSVRDLIRPSNDMVRFLPGFFPDSATKEVEQEKFCFVHLDADLYQSTLSGLNFFYPRVSVGGFILVHDYNAWIGARTAVDEFMSGKPEVLVPLPDKSGSVLIVKQ